MRIIIVGAGVGGLSASIALAQTGHKVTVYESAPHLAEIGAGVQMSPNAAKLFWSWGLGPDLLAKAALPQGLFIYRWDDGRLLQHTQLWPDFEKKYGAPYFVIHRAHLHDILHRHALKAGVEIRVASRVVDYDFKGGSIMLENGEMARADLVIAVDGINSFARRKFLGDADVGAYKTGWAAFRAMVDVKDIIADPDTAWIVSKPDLHLWVGGNRSAMTYTIAAGERLNMVFSHVDDIETANWGSERLMSEIKHQFAGWDPMVTKLISRMRPDPQNWPVFQVGPLETWVSNSGKFVLMGDAAHAMAFYLSMGVSMAVEDAAALAECLTYVESPESIRPAVSVFETVRKHRTRRVQELSLDAGRVLHMSDGPEQEARDAAVSPDHDGEGTSKNSYGLTDARIRDWCYAYDAVEEVRKEWKNVREITTQ